MPDERTTDQTDASSAAGGAVHAARDKQNSRSEIVPSGERPRSLDERLDTVNATLRRKLAELDADNHELTNLIAATDIPTLILDAQLRVKRFTPPTSRLFRLSPKDVGRPLQEVESRLTDNTVVTDAASVLATSSPVEKEVCTVDDRWYLRRILPYGTLDNLTGGVIITFVDITARMAAQAEARRLASVLRDSRDAIVISTLDGRITGWNRGAEAAYGYIAAEALEMNVRDLMPESDRHSLTQLYDRAARGEEPDSFEAKRRTRSGRVRDVWVSVTALKDENGQTRAIASAERDVTARHEAEAEIRRQNAELERRFAARALELEESEQRIRAILGAAVDAIITIDTDGLIETFNKSAESMFGYAASEAIGRNVSMLMGKAYRHLHDHYLRRYLRTGERRVIGRQRNFRGRRKDGTEFPMQLTVSEVDHMGIFTGIIRDTTEQRALQEEIVRVATVEQRRIARELHDGTQQELTGLGLLARNLADSLAASPMAAERELAARIADGIAETNRNVRRLANGLLPVPVDADGLMVALDELAQRTASDYKMRCVFECRSPVRITDDNTAMQLYRIVQEAVTNAVKHSGASQVTIRLDRSADALTVSIDDDGVGIGNKPPRSDGLGLRIMEHRCETIGGTLSIRGGEFSGTLVECRIPVTSLS